MLLLDLSDGLTLNLTVMVLMTTYLDFYALLKHLIGSVQAVLFGSVQPEAQKTMTVKLSMKIAGDINNIIDCGSTPQAMDQKRSTSTWPFCQDDIEGEGSKNKQITKSYDATSNYSIGRGKTEKNSGLILTHNIDISKKMPAKIGTGGRVTWIVVERDEEYIMQEMGENCDMEDEILQKLNSQIDCLSFICSLTKAFLKPTSDTPAPWQKYRREATLKVAQQMPHWAAKGWKRKIKAYATIAAMLRLIYDCVIEDGSARAMSLFREFFGSVEEFEDLSLIHI